MRRSAIRPTLERCEDRILLAKKLYLGNLTYSQAGETVDVAALVGRVETSVPTNSASSNARVSTAGTISIAPDEVLSADQY